MQSQSGHGAARILLVSEVPGDPMLASVGEALSAAGHAVEVAEGVNPRDTADFDLVVSRPAVAMAPELTQDVEIGRLRIDVTRRMIYVDGNPVRLSAREFTLLHHLAAHPDVVFSRSALLRAVWGSTWRTEGSVTEYIRRLRMLLAPTGIGECIVTRKGFGYSFDPDAVR